MPGKQQVRLDYVGDMEVVADGILVTEDQLGLRASAQGERAPYEGG